MKRILFVYGKGGVPVDYAMLRMAAHGQVHVLALAEPMAGSWRGLCASIIPAWHGPPLVGEELVETIMRTATAVRADAVIGFSEYLLLSVSLAAQRLGLSGPGDGIWYARDKRRMRERWAGTGVPVPEFRRVGSAADLDAAFAELTAPMLLKPAWAAGSFGQQVLRTRRDLTGAWRSTTRALSERSRGGDTERYETQSIYQLLVEEIIAGTTEGWYDQPGYGDYLSVEGIVAGGVYHPIAITGRIPTIPPFTELSSHAPCALPESLQRKVEDAARAAVNALGLDTCGTHTELKLCSDGEIVPIESAARLGGSAITEVVHRVFGVDLVDLLVRQLLGLPVEYPRRMLVTGSSAAAELSLIGTNSTGRPWTTSPVWNARTARLDRLVSAGSTITHVPALTKPDNTVVPRYDQTRGGINCVGMLLLTAPNSRQLMADTYAVLDGMEQRLHEAMAAEAA